MSESAGDRWRKRTLSPSIVRFRAHLSLSLCLSMVLNNGWQRDNKFAIRVHWCMYTSASNAFLSLSPFLPPPSLSLSLSLSLWLMQDSQDLRKMQRSDMKNGITEIAHGGVVDRWLVVRKQMDHASQVRMYRIWLIEQAFTQRSKVPIITVHALYNQ